MPPRLAVCEKLAVCDPKLPVCEKYDSKNNESACATIEHTADRSSSAARPAVTPAVAGCGRLSKTLRGQVLAAHHGGELPVTDVHVELYAVGPLQAVALHMSKEVLAHIRALLLERAMPIDLYQNGGHVADAPQIGFADILQLRDIPGYELLAAAARTQPDASFKQLLGNNPAVLKPLLCYYHPGSFPAACVASTLSDAAGFFEFTVPQSASADLQPGYRFIVRRSISISFYITLYNPTPAGWHTHWDWPKGKVITLRTRHPLALRAHTQT